MLYTTVWISTTWKSLVLMITWASNWQFPSATEFESTLYKHIYVYVYIIIHCFVVSQLFSVARHVERLKLGSKPAQFYVRLSIIPLSPQANHISSGIIRHYVAAFVCLHFCLTGYQSAQFIRRAFHIVFLRIKSLFKHIPLKTVEDFLSRVFKWRRSGLLIIFLISESR